MTSVSERATATAAGTAVAAQKSVVVIGGGTGSFNALTGLKQTPCRITAVVVMTDSGGSSGRLRDEFGQLPPGDLRQCLLALSPDDRAGILLRQLFNYRFSKGDGLEGHNFGNLFITALTEITGSTESAIREAGRLLGIKGQVLPVTLTNASLCARLENGKDIVGEANIDHRTLDIDIPIDYVFLKPKAFVYPLTTHTIEEADAIVIGPGDLYTSVIANLVVDGLSEAILRSKAKKIYVCNLMTKHGESDSFKVSDFVKEVNSYLGSRSAIEYVIVNSEPISDKVLQRYTPELSTQVEFDEAATRALAPHVVAAPLVGVGAFVRHDPHRLADVILKIVTTP